MKRVMTGDFLSGLNISEVWAKSQSVAAPPETRAYSLLYIRLLYTAVGNLHSSIALYHTRCYAGI